MMKGVKELTKKEATIAEAAKLGALEILRDALKKEDKVLMKLPEKVVLKGGERGAFWMERYAILTEYIVKDLLAELEKVTFKKNITVSHLQAYVYPNDEKRTIYLCNPFWRDPKSAPCTLIHEVSHFLGAEDLTYEPNTISLGCKGSVIKDCSESSSAISPPNKDNFWDALKKAFWNANSITYEFELTISHRGYYWNGKYSCCGETARYSVCEKSVPDYFHSCNIDETWKTEILLNKLLERAQTILPSMRKLSQIVDEMDEFPRQAKVVKEVGLSATITGGVACMGLLLAPATFGLSTLVTVGVPVASMAVTSVSTLIFNARATRVMKEFYDIFPQCQRSSAIQRFLKFLNDGAQLPRDYRQEAEFYTFLVKVLVFINGHKSRKDNGQ